MNTLRGYILRKIIPWHAESPLMSLAYQERMYYIICLQVLEFYMYSHLGTI